MENFLCFYGSNTSNFYDFISFKLVILYFYDVVEYVDMKLVLKVYSGIYVGISII